MRKYLKPRDHGYLMEAAGCAKVVKELRRIEAKFERAVNKESAARQSELEQVMHYSSEREIQNDYGWDFLTEEQYYRFLDLFREGEAALENHAPTTTELALHIVRRILLDIDAEQREWEFSALSPEDQRAELARAEQSKKEWKEKIAEIKRRRGIMEAGAPQTEVT